MKPVTAHQLAMLLGGMAMGLSLGLTPLAAEADARTHPEHKRKGCHSHMHSHGRDLAHRHPHCHHHDHDRGRHSNGRRDGRYDDYTGYDGGHDGGHGYDNDRRTLPAPPPPPHASVRPPKPPTPPAPWEIARQFGIAVDFSSGDKAQIDRYFRKTRRKAEISGPPHLPPGTDHKIKKGVIIPPGIPVRSIPSGLKSRLAALPSGHHYGVVGKTVIIYDKRTRIIKDTEKAF